MNIEAGIKYHLLTPLRRLDDPKRKEETWVCQCDCGNETLATKSQLLHGFKKSCGCLRRKSPPNLIDLTSKRFGKLTVIQRAGKTKQENALWLCKCDCGNTIHANGTTLRRGEITSCGCQLKVRIENAKRILQTVKTIDGVQVPLLTKKVRSDSQTGHKGVTQRRRKGKIYYEASITLKGKRKYLGMFQDIEKAIAARQRAEQELFGPYLESMNKQMAKEQSPHLHNKE